MADSSFSVLCLIAVGQVLNGYAQLADDNLGISEQLLLEILGVHRDDNKF